MKFSKSIFGYSINEVNKINHETLAKYDSLKISLYSQLENANKEYHRLVEQRNILISSLHSARTSLNLYNKELLDITLNKAEKNAFLKIEDLTKEHEEFIVSINKTIEDIDNIMEVLKLKYIKMTDALNESIKSIVKNSTDEKLVNTSLYNTIEQLCSFDNPSIKPFKAIDLISLETQVNKIIPSTENNKGNERCIETQPNKPKTVVIAENDAEVSSLLSHVLEREGFNTILISDGYSLINMIKEKEPPGIILLDTLLPYIKTNILLKEIRDSKSWCNVPIIVTTSEQNKKTISEALDWGANDSLEKPFNTRELVARVRRFFKEDS